MFERATKIIKEMREIREEQMKKSLQLKLQERERAISYDAAYEDGHPSAMGIQKVKINETIDNLPLGEELQEVLRDLASRSRLGKHLVRMLDPARSSAEQTFAIAYLEYQNIVHEEIGIDVRDDAVRVMTQEGVDTTLFWTYAPYLYKVLQAYGVEPKESIKKVILWGSKGKSYQGDVHLLGLEKFNEFRIGKRYYILSSNPEGDSHKYTEQEARKIVDQYFMSNE